MNYMPQKDMQQKTKKLHKYFILSLVFFAFILIIGGMGLNTAEARGTSTSARNCRYTHHCSYGVITKDGISYNVTGSATYTRKCGENSFPSWGCNFVKNEILDRLGPTSLSATWGLACGNTHSFTASLTTANGACGSATSTPVTNFPIANLCNVGTVSATSTGATTHNWTCNGISGGTNATCSAPRTSTFNLSCSVFPAVGTINSNIRFTGQITGTSTPTNLFTFQWYLNNIASTTLATNTIRIQFPKATTTAQVEVVAKLGAAERKAYCTFNRIECPTGQVSCMDVTPVESYECAVATTSCPTSACGTTTAKELDISKDYQLPAGSILSTTSPSAAYISTNLLCKSDNILKVVPTSSWNFSPGYSTWRWECTHPSAISFATCKARCGTGKFYCAETNTCVADGSSCFCPLEGTGPDWDYVDQALHCVNDDGTCYACDKVINYFKLAPDEVEKTNPASKCGANWTTNDIIPAKYPLNTTATQVVCNMKSATTSYPVLADMPSPGPTQPLGISAYALTCTQQYQVSTDPGVWKNFQDETIEAKCRATPMLLER